MMVGLMVVDWVEMMVVLMACRMVVKMAEMKAVL